MDPMQNPHDAFLQPHYADEPLDDVVQDWLNALEVRNLSEHTIMNYRKSMLSFTRSLQKHKKPLTLASLSESNVLQWQKDLRGVVRDVSARSYLINVKVFANRWVKRRYSNTDLLDLVEIGKEVVEQKDGLSPDEREKILLACSGPSFEDVRDRAFIQLLLATACRFKEIHGLTTNDIDLDAKRMWVVLKGGRTVPVDLDGRALRDFKIYLGRRRQVAAVDEQHVWLADGGKPLTYWGAHAIFTRLTAELGFQCNPHRFRHTLAQHMAESGAPIADIQDALHHTSDHMSRRYIGNARQDVAAGLAKKWSLAG